MGVITSLGQGLDGQLGGADGRRFRHPRASRAFPRKGLSTRIAGTVDFIDVPAPNAVERSYAFARETTDGSTRRRPGFPAISTVRSSSPRRRSSRNGAPASSSPTGRRPSEHPGDAYERFLAAMRTSARIRPSTKPCIFGAISERLADRFGTRGLPVTLSTACASGATAIQLGVEAIRQGRTDRALAVATDGSVSAEALIRFSLLSALSTQNEPPDQGLQALQQGSRRFRHRRRCSDAGARISWKRRSARGATRTRHHEGLRREGRLSSTAPVRRRMAARRSRRSARRLPMPASMKAASATSMLTAPRRRKTTRWNMASMLAGLRRAHGLHSGVLQQVDDRPYADGGRRGRSGVLAADHAHRHACRRRSTTTTPDPAIVLDVVPNVKRDAAGHAQCFRTPSASAARTPALSWRSEPA